MKQDKTTIAYVCWFDAYMSGFEPTHPDDATGLHENESAGILLAEDRDSVTLAADHDLTTGNVRQTICIPKVNIRSIKRFAVKRCNPPAG